MKTRNFLTFTAIGGICLLAWFAVAVLLHWNWRQDKSGGPQAGLSRRKSYLERRLSKHELLADARTLAALARYLCEPELPVHVYQNFMPVIGLTNHYKTNLLASSTPPAPSASTSFGDSFTTSSPWLRAFGETPEYWVSNRRRSGS